MAILSLVIIISLVNTVCFFSFQSSTIPVISTEMEVARSAMPLSQRVRTYTECLLVMTCCFAGATYTSVNVAGP